MRRIVDLKILLSVDPTKAVELFDSIVNQEDDGYIQEACQTMANYIRHSSVYKRKMIYSQLQKSSLLCRFYLSFQFHRFEDSIFPRSLIFNGKSVRERPVCNNPHRRHHVTAVGSNRFFNLGVLSDGSPVEEPRLVSVPRVTAIEMSNTHTIFLTAENQLFGCGKASSFLPERTDETDGGYMATPSLISIPQVPKNSKIEELKVTEGGSQFSINGQWYFIGKCPFRSGVKRIASNCFVSTEEFKVPEVQIKYQNASIPFEGSTQKINVAIIDGVLHWDRNPTFNARKEISLVINGNPVNASFDNYRVCGDGEIYLCKHGVLKGKLEFWKNQDDGFVVKSGTVMEHFDTKYTLVALLEEVPGTIGTEFFAVSPDGQNLIMKVGYQSEEKLELLKLQSLNTHFIVKNREEQCDPVEIPTDLTFCFQNADGTTTEYPTNRLIFEMMFPELKSRIQHNEFHFPHESFLSPLDRNLRKYVFSIDLDSPRQFPKPNDMPLEFVPNGTDSSMIWNLVTTDKKRIPFHKYLLLLHSRQIGAMQRFSSNQMSTYGSYQFEDQERSEENKDIEANATSETVLNALRGILNPISLFNIKTIELIECINFYDYHLMDELFDDAMLILMETITDYTLPFLYELFISYDEKVVEGLLKRPYLLFDSISTVVPPKELLVQFCQRFQHKPSQNQISGGILNCQPECIVKYFLDIDQDSEEIVWKSIGEEFGVDLKSSKIEAMKRKEERKRVRSRNTSHTFRPDTFNCSVDSSPIPIGDRTKNDRVTNSPLKSPISFSMSPVANALPIPCSQNRTNSISNSLEDFPEMGSFSPASPAGVSKMKSPGGRFVPKGTRFVNANQILKPAAAINPWKRNSESIREEEILTKPIIFDDVVQKEEKLQKNIRTGFRKVRLLPHVETEELAESQILEVFKREYQDEALVYVELVTSNDLIEDDQIVWGSMPGLVRR